MSMTLVAAAVTPVSGGGTGATTAAGARKNLGIATVADVAWTDLWKDTSRNYVRWACRNNVVYVKWKIPQASTAQWKAGILPAGYRPSEGTVTVAAWTEGNRMAVGWVDTYGAVFFQVNSAQTNGTNQGSLSYPIVNGTGGGTDDSGTTNPNPGVGVEYTAGEGIWIEDHVINADVTQPELDSVAASIPTRMTDSEILAILER